MELKTVMLAHLASCENILRDGHDLIPSWLVTGPDGSWLIFTRFDHDKPEQLERLFYLMNRFMVWKLANGFVLGMEAWLGPEKTRRGEEAVIAIAVSRGEKRGVMRRINRTEGSISFGAHEWLGSDDIDGTFFSVLPSRTDSLSAEEAAMLNDIFGEDGEMPASKIS
ncbi:MAG: hypothetical protein ACLP1W_03630 [Rhodomicrobium sp.]